MAEGFDPPLAGSERDEVNACNLCGALENLSLCSGCRGIWYCSKAHQREDWRDHKETCKKSKVKGSNKDNDQSLESNGIDSSSMMPTMNDSRYSSLCQTDCDKDAVTQEMSSANNLKTAVAKPASNVKVKMKKKSKRDKTSLPPISEDGAPPERFYLSSNAHRLKIPSTLRRQWLNHKTASLGQDEKQLSVKETKEQYLSILWARFRELASYVVDCLTKYGICVLDKFLGEATGQEILNEVLQIKAKGIMQQGQLVQGPTSASNKYIRGDMISWVDNREPRSENIHFLISCMDAVVIHCNSKLEKCTINERTKAMVACYPGQRTKYVRHVDNPNGDGRCITCIYYLNKDWDVKQHGGLLRIYPDGSDQVANIEPKFDRLLFFWSDRRNPHEVEQAFAERFAITVWYYDAEERADALKRFQVESELANQKKEAATSDSSKKEEKEAATCDSSKKDEKEAATSDSSKKEDSSDKRNM